MFAGHIGAALAIGRAERRINIGAFIAAALLLDLLLWLFVLLEWEAVAISPNFTSTHQPEFIFPFSHGLVASLVWSAVAGAVALAWSAYQRAPSWRAGALIAAAVFSHWLLDALVHRPELPLAGANSAKVGFGLWQNMPIALTAEAAIVVIGLSLYLTGNDLPRRNAIGLAALTLITLAFTAVGMTIAPAPPSARAMASSSLGALVVICALGCWLGRSRRERQADQASPLE